MNLLRCIFINMGVILVFIQLNYQGLPVLAKTITLHRVKKSIHTEEPESAMFNEKISVVKRESVESGSGVGSNIYLSLWYDARKNDLLIEGSIPETQHWSMVPYDIGTSYPVNSWVEKDSLETSPDGSYEVILSTNPVKKRNSIDVSKTPVGLLLFRYTNPIDPQNAISKLPRVKKVSNEM